MVKMCRVLNIPHDVISFDETERVNVQTVADKLKSNTYTHVAIIHCETSSGILNPIEEIGQLVYDHGSKKGFFLVFSFYQINLPLRFNCLHRRFDEWFWCYSYKPS